MQQIRITRDSNNNVEFETVSVDKKENVFFINLDPLEPHWPSLASNQLGAAPSKPSSECQPNARAPFPAQVPYTCQIAGHTTERGIINVFDVLQGATTTLEAALNGHAITEQQVVKGGMSPYKITSELFQVTTGPGGAVIQSGSGIGPGLQLNPKTDNTGVWVTGTPALSGTYNFTFTVDDGMGVNLQLVQYKMVVS